MKQIRGTNIRIHSGSEDESSTASSTTRYREAGRRRRRATTDDEYTDDKEPLVRRPRRSTTVILLSFIKPTGDINCTQCHVSRGYVSARSEPDDLYAASPPTGQGQPLAPGFVSIQSRESGLDDLNNASPPAGQGQPTLSSETAPAQSGKSATDSLPLAGEEQPTISPRNETGFSDLDVRNSPVSVHLLLTPVRRRNETLNGRLMLLQTFWYVTIRSSSATPKEPRPGILRLTSLRREEVTSKGVAGKGSLGSAHPKYSP